MDGLEELSNNKAESSINTTYFDGKYDITNQVDLLPADNVLDNPNTSVNLPPPLPGVFLFDQPNQKKNKSIIDSNFNPLVTSSYDSTSQTLSNTGSQNPNQYRKRKYSELDRPVSELNLNQKYFQSTTSNVFDYQASEQGLHNKQQPIAVSDVDSLLPPHGNAYQSLQPVPANLFDTTPHCEPKVYQQLEPVSRNEYRVDMEKFVEQRFYQELNPLSSIDSKLPKNEIKTYQQMRSVPDLHFIGGQSTIRSIKKTPQQKPEIPPEYATSKLYQQLSKPPKKQVKTNHPPEVKSYHQLSPTGHVERSKHNISQSLSQQVSSYTNRPVTAQTSSKVYYQHQINDQTHHPQLYKTFQNVKASNYGSDTNVISSTINLSPKPNKLQSPSRGFQEHKPKVYLELRNPEPRIQTSISSGSFQGNCTVDQPYHGSTSSYDDGNITRHASKQYQNIHSSDLQAQIIDKPPSMRLPSPFEFKLPQNNMSNRYRVPKILGHNQYNDFQEHSRGGPMLDSSTNHSLRSLNENVSSSDVIPPYHKDVKISPCNTNIASSLTQTQLSFDGSITSDIGKQHDELNPLNSKNEINRLSVQVVSDTTPETVPDLDNQFVIDMKNSNTYVSHRRSVFEHISTHNLSNHNDNISVFKENGNLAQNENNVNYYSNTSNILPIEKSVIKSEIADTNRSSCSILIERKSKVALEISNERVGELKCSVAYDSGPESVMPSTENSHHYSSCNETNEQGSKEEVLSNQTNVSVETVSNVEDLSNLSNSDQLSNKVTINKVYCEVEENIKRMLVSPLADPETKIEEKLENSLIEEPTDLSLNSHEVDRKSDNYENKDSTLSSQSSSEITRIQSLCSQNNNQLQISCEVTSLDKSLIESDELSSKSPQKTGPSSAEVIVKENSMFCTDGNAECKEHVMSFCNSVVYEKDFENTETISPLDKTEKAVTACQTSFKPNNLKLDENQDSGSSSSFLTSNVGTPRFNDTPNGSSISSIVPVVNSEPEINCNKESKAIYEGDNISLSSKDISVENSADLGAQPDIINKNQSALYADNCLGNNLCASGEEKDKQHFENVTSPHYTSFITKKTRILYNTQLLSDKVKKSCSEMSTDLESKNSLAEQDSVFSEAPSFNRIYKDQSESIQTSKPMGADYEKDVKICTTLSSVNNIDLNSKEIVKSTAIVNNIGKECCSLDRTQPNVEEVEKWKCETPNVSQATANVNNNLLSETQSNLTTENIPLSKEYNTTQSNASVQSLAKSKLKCILNEGNAQTENNRPELFENMSVNDSVPLEMRHSVKKKYQHLTKKLKILQSEQNIDRSQTPNPVLQQTGPDKIKVGTSRKSGSQLENCNTIICSTNEEKELKVDETDVVQCQSPINKSQSTSIVPEQTSSSLGTRSSLKRKIRDGLGITCESSTKCIPLANDSAKSPESSATADNLSDHKPLTIKTPVKKICSRKDYIMSSQDLMEVKDDIEKSVSKKTTSTKSSYLNKSKSPRVDTQQDERSAKTKRKYRKRNKFEVCTPVKKGEPLLKSKYSKRIIKKKNLDFEPVEPVKKPKKLKRKYTTTKHKKLPIKKESGENQTVEGKKSPPFVVKMKYELVDPLESNKEVRPTSKEGLISDDEGEAVFLGFDSPQEEDDTVLGFDFKEEDDEMEPINEFLQHLDADSMTVECDPRSLLQAPGVTTQCPQCDKTLDSHQELVDHMQVHKSIKYSGVHVCSICLRHFGTKAQLNKHIKWNHEGGKCFSCPVCSKRFTTGAYVKKHLATVHKQHEAELKYICPDCTLSFPSEKKLRKHVDKVHKKTLYQCNTCLKNFLRLANLERHKLSHETENQKFPCAYCNEKFDSRVKLHTHWLVHTEKKLFTCEICSSTFTALPSLRRHKVLHGGEKLFRCDICQKSFALMSTLKTHLLVHTGIKSFPCKLCDKSFNRQDVLNTHQWIHTGEKKFECDICFQKFRWRHAVKSHKLIYHSTEKPFECEICSKRFSHPESFKKHREVHAEKLYYCQICLKAFSRPSSLKIHILIHTDLKPFVCDMCNKAFRHKSHLRKHFLVHTTEKPWLCKFCNRMYKDRSQLRRHKRVVHCKNFFNKVLPGMPESMKTVQNFEMITAGETSLDTNKEYFPESNVFNSENLMSQSSKHFLLSNMEPSLSNSEDNSVPESMEEKSSSTEDSQTYSANIEGHLTDAEENIMLQTEAIEMNDTLKQENVLPPSAF